MNKTTSFWIAAVIIVALLLSIPLGLLRNPICDDLWNAYTDVRLRYITPPEIHSGTIAAINPSNREFLLMTTPTCGLPITIDRLAEPPFRDRTYKVGDQVTVHLGSRMSGSRNYSQYYLREIAFKN